MFKIFKMVENIVRDEAGATAIEYSLIAALLSVAAIFAINAYGQSVANAFSSLSVTVSTFSATQATLP